MLYINLEDAGRRTITSARLSLTRQIKFYTDQTLLKAHKGYKLGDICLTEAGFDKEYIKSWKEDYKKSNGVTEVPKDVGKTRVLYLRGDFLLINDYLTDPNFVGHLINNYTKIDRRTFIYGCKTYNTRTVKKQSKAVNLSTMYDSKFSICEPDEIYPIMDDILRHPNIKIDTNCFDYTPQDTLPVKYFLLIKRSIIKGHVRCTVKINPATHDNFKGKLGAIRGWNKPINTGQLTDLGKAEKVLEVPF